MRPKEQREENARKKGLIIVGMRKKFIFSRIKYLIIFLAWNKFG